MTDPKATLLKLNQNLNILQEREAKYAGNAPLDLLNQISDHQQAIDLTRQAITSELGEAEWREALKPLLLACQDGQVINLEAETYIVGDQIITNIYKVPSPPLPPAEAKERHDLGILLNKVKTFWIEGVLEKSIHNIALIELGKETQAEAVAHPWEQVLELPDQSCEILPPDKKISHIFEEMNRAILILGEPGSGKTITLLQLAQELVVQAEADETFSQPVPVVFNLSSWTDKREALIDWMVTELSTKYQIPKRISRPWLENNRILPLLDGLDEVKPENQAACVEAINCFGEEFGLSGLVVCSRLREYTRLSVRLKLNGAIRLQPFTVEQIYDYLDVAGSRLDALRTVLQTDKELQEMARSPLILSIMSLTYQDMPVKALSDQVIDTIEIRRTHLFDTYIERMFKRKGGGKKPYSDTQIKSWLAWLARQMRYHNQSLFLIEQLQPSWLPNRALIRFYIFASRLIGGLILGFLFARVAGVYAGIYFGLIGGLCVALLDMLRYEQFGKHITVTKPRLWRWSIIYAIFVGMLAGIVSGVYLGLIFGLRGGLNVAINSALLFGVVFGLRGSWQNLKYDVRTVESLGWSWHKALKGGGYGLIIGLIWGVVYHLNSLIIGPVFDVLFLAQLLLPLSMNLMMVGVILGGLTSSVMESKTRPNQGIWLSLRNVGLAALLFGLGIKISNVVADLMITFVSVLNNNDSIEVSVDMLIRVSALAFKNVGMTAAVLAILWYGGLDIIQHYILRLILWIERDVPRNYPQFLDYCVDRIFLRRVGGGYIFIHRLLLEHFAAMNVEGK